MQSQPGPNPPMYLASAALVGPTLPLLPALQVALEAGADGIELQADRIDLALQADELNRLPELLHTFHAPPILRSAQSLFVNGVSQRDWVYPALLQAHTFGCRLVVFPLGDVEHADSDALDALRDTLARLGQDFPGLRFAAVNEDRVGGTDPAGWGRFLGAAASWPVPVGMSFDLGAWVCSGSDPAGPAQSLGQYVAYVRVAAAAMQNGRCIAQPIRPSEVALSALRDLPTGAPRAIAFPVPAPDRALLAARLSEYIAMVRSGCFTL